MVLRVNQGETYVSVDLEVLLIGASLPPTHHLKPGQWAARTTAGKVRANGLGVTHIPLCENPQHGGIWGLDGLEKKAREMKQRALALACEVISLPPGAD